MESRIKTILVIAMLSCGISIWGQQLTPNEEAAIEKLFENYKDKAGVAVGIFQQGQISFARGYGVANFESQERIDAGTLFDLASVSKQITAACIFLLQEQGKLSVDDPIVKYLPSLPEYKEGPIRVKHLIGHTSGLRSYLKLLYARGVSWSSEFSNAQGVELLSDQQGINFVPGTKFSYSNTGYLLLANIIEAASGMSYEAYAKANLFDPLGMNATRIGHPVSGQKGVALGYAPQADGFDKEHFTKNTAVGDGGVYSTILDMFLWSENLRTARVGGPSWKKHMLQSGVLNNGKETHYAGGLFLGDYQNIPGFYTIGHSGEWAGYRSLFFKFTEQDVAFVILSNNTGTNVWSLLNQMVSIVLGDQLEIARAAGEDHQSNDHGNIKSEKDVVIDLAQYRGNYFNPVEGYTREITLKNDTLRYVRTNGAETPLVTHGDDSFQFLGMPHVTLHFDLGSTSKKLFLHINDNAPIILDKYLPVSYADGQIKQFEGTYHSEELDVQYDIKAVRGQLSVLVSEKELVRLDPVMENVFNDVHFGYLKFERNAHNQIQGFSINDELVRDIYFKKTG